VPKGNGVMDDLSKAIIVLLKMNGRTPTYVMKNRLNMDGHGLDVADVRKACRRLEVLNIVELCSFSKPNKYYWKLK
jgi:DNA-binding Lrp family transcriptional regulator